MTVSSPSKNTSHFCEVFYFEFIHEIAMPILTKFISIGVRRPRERDRPAPKLEASSAVRLLLPRPLGGERVESDAGLGTTDRGNIVEVRRRATGPFLILLATDEVDRTHELARRELGHRCGACHEERQQWAFHVPAVPFGHVERQSTLLDVLTDISLILVQDDLLHHQIVQQEEGHLLGLAL